MNYSYIILCALHVVFALFFFILYVQQGKSVINITPIRKQTVYPLIILTIILFANYPSLPGSDKYNYLVQYLHSDSLHILDQKEYVLIFIAKIIHSIGGESGAFFYFLFLATFYCSSYYIFAKRYFGDNYLAYFIVFAFMSLGFTAYGINTIRAGIGLSFILLALSARTRWKILLFYIISFLAHKSMILPISALLVTKYYKNTKVYIAIWFLCLILASLGVRTDTAFAQFSSFDTRVIGYTSYNMTEESIYLYAPRFRPDFIIYSLAPIFISAFWVFKCRVRDNQYIRLLNSYILLNSIWLLVIRQAFTDRFAYLSWFLIPYLLTFPVINNHITVKYPKRLLFSILFFYFIVNVILFLK